MCVCVSIVSYFLYGGRDLKNVIDCELGRKLGSEEGKVRL